MCEQDHTEKQYRGVGQSTCQPCITPYWTGMALQLGDSVVSLCLKLDTTPHSCTTDYISLARTAMYKNRNDPVPILDGEKTNLT